VAFLDPVPGFHGRRDRNEPEWPPSPLRVFQSLVAAAASRWRGTHFADGARPALQWFERIQSVSPPLIVAPHYHVGTAVRVAVPNNDMDSPASYWAKGQEPKKPHRPIDLRPLKTVRPVRLMNDEDRLATVYYLTPLKDGLCPYFDVLATAARSVTHLGWGVDMVAASASIVSHEDAAKFPGERWESIEHASTDVYRIPVKGTLDALSRRQIAFLNRVAPDGFNPVPPFSTFRVVGYRRATEPSQRQYAAFTLLKPDASGMKSFEPLRRTRDVAGMMRHALAAAGHDLGWTDEQINVFIHGKTPDGQHPASGQASPDRFQYLPLPTVNHALGRIESIRRVLIAAPPHCGGQVAWARRALAGAELVNQAGAAALLTILPKSDWVLRQYTETSTTWSTVTPVILPGYDDPDHLRRKLKGCRDAETQKRYLARLDARVEQLLRKAFRQAGYSAELTEHAETEWRAVGFRPGVELASRYLPPDNLDHAPRIHVQVRFPVPIPGPLAIGSGRFRGFGLFVSTQDS
ncbi:MAG: type I-U CRISPR-associated protein Cas5/Cas6, partial [Planctomycetes bacterium]|nr:type I-U CRISPR-associated protein Cas5/Cas6 [Planctomycetota bacterium]